MAAPPRRRPPMHLDFGGTDDLWSDPEGRYEGHLRTLVVLVATIGLVASAGVLLSPSILILAAMLVPAALIAAALTWHTRPRRIPDYRAGRSRRIGWRRRGVSPRGR